MRYWHLAIPSAMTPRLASVPLEQTSVAQWSWGFPDVRWCSISWVDPNFRCRFGVVKNMMFLCQFCSVPFQHDQQSNQVPWAASPVFWKSYVPMCPLQLRTSGPTLMALPWTGIGTLGGPHGGAGMAKASTWVTSSRSVCGKKGIPHATDGHFLAKKRGTNQTNIHYGSLWMFRKSKINLIYSLWMFRKSKINHNESNPRSGCPAAKIPHWCIIIFVPLH